MVGSGSPLLTESSLRPTSPCGVGHALEQVEGALEGLDTTARGG